MAKRTEKRMGSITDCLCQYGRGTRTGVWGTAKEGHVHFVICVGKHTCVVAGMHASMHTCALRVPDAMHA